MISNDNFDDFDFYLKGFIEEKNSLTDLNNKIGLLKNRIENINWNQLILKDKGPNSTNTHCFEVHFSEDITRELIAIKCIYNKFRHLSSVAEENLFGIGGSLASYFIIQISKLDNRIDIANDGIAPGFRRLGLGCKLYRKMLDKFDFISSEERHLSDFGKLLWNSMRKNEMFYTFYTPFRAFSFSSEKPANEILNILIVETQCAKLFLWDDNFFEQNRDLIINSEMKRFIS